MTFDHWKPGIRQQVDFTAMPLSEEEGFVLSRIDGISSVADIHKMTNISPQKLRTILTKLVKCKAIDITNAPQEITGEDTQKLSKIANPRIQSAQKSTADTEETEGPWDEEIRNYRKIYQTKMKHLSNDERMKLAKTASSEELSALCFDQEPQVINSIFENPNTGLPHARLIANHHRNPIGIDSLGRRQHFINDRTVQKFLFRNPQTSNAVLNLIIRQKQLFDLYTLTRSGELSERAKRQAHSALRTRFQRGGGDECVALIIKTEGRCLMLLTGIPLDGRTISLLCSRAFHSTLLIQNLARWPTTPPGVLQHLAKQPMVRRTQRLKMMILQHPNCPNQLKRL